MSLRSDAGQSVKDANVTCHRFLNPKIVTVGSSKTELSRQVNGYNFTPPVSQKVR